MTRDEERAEALAAAEARYFAHKRRYHRRRDANALDWLGWAEAYLRRMKLLQPFVPTSAPVGNMSWLSWVPKEGLA